MTVNEVIKHIIPVLEGIKVPITKKLRKTYARRIQRFGRAFFLKE